MRLRCRAGACPPPPHHGAPSADPEAKAIARDQGLCQAPGCSRTAVHAHHVQFRSAGGGNELTNLSALRAAHHLVAVHRGYLRVRGQAPDRLRWEVVELGQLSTS